MEVVTYLRLHSEFKRSECKKEKVPVGRHLALGSMGGGSKGQLEICLQSGGTEERLSGSLIA